MKVQEKRDNGLMVGAARVDITPWEGVQIAGAVGARRFAESVLDSLHAGALVVSNGKSKICVVSVDLTIITKAQSDIVRKEAAERFGFDPDAVVVHATQTHTAPGLGHFMLDNEFKGVPDSLSWLRGGDEAYSEFAVKKILEAVERADKELRPAQIGSYRAIEGRLAFNRRAVRKDGKVFMPWRPPPRPFGFTDIVYLEGPIDPEVAVICFRTDDMQIPAVLAHYTCHPVHVFPRCVISADWPGALCVEIKRALGDGCVPMVINGCCGNINPFDPFDPDYGNDHQRMGRMLGDTCASMFDSMQYESVCDIGFASRSVSLTYRDLDDAALEKARGFLAENPDVIWADDNKTQVDRDWFRAANLVSLDLQRRREKTLEYEIQVLRIGDCAIVGLPGEPFVEAQLRIKMASPAKQTIVAHCVNQYVGYLPTREAFARGGHEVDPSTWSRVTPDALDMIVECANSMTSDLFGDKET